MAGLTVADQFKWYLAVQQGTLLKIAASAGCSLSQSYYSTVPTSSNL